MSRAVRGVVAAALLAAPLSPVSDPPPAAARTLVVSPRGPFSSLRAALRRAGAGDTVVVRGGEYRGPVRIRRPVVLLGRGRPVIDGGGRGHVVEARARLVLEGFRLVSSGRNPAREHAGVMVRGARARIADNVLRDVYYGIYLKDAARSVVRGNRIRGKDLPLPRRGDGIRLWYSPRTRVVENVVRGTRDVVVFFSDHIEVRRNVIRDGRYGLHYMYSDHNLFAGNRFVGNEVGAFIMYSRDVTLQGNVFSRSSGASGFGLGLKDADRIRAAGNLFLGNEVGVYLDNSPRSGGVTNRFAGNLFLDNHAGVRILPSVSRNRFSGNGFVANRRPVEIGGRAGEGQAGQNRWRANHWGGYRGFDRDGDGAGNRPYVYAELSDRILSRHPGLRLFTRSPAMAVVELMGRVFPFLQPEPVLADSLPRLSRPTLRYWESAASRPQTAPRPEAAGGPAFGKKGHRRRHGGAGKVRPGG